MSALACWREGMRRVNRAPAILAGVWLMTSLASLPLTLALRARLEQDLGTSMAADAAASGVNYEWMEEFSDRTTGIGLPFTPDVIGFGAVLDNLSAFIDNVHRPAAIAGAAAAYIVLWLFLAGGILDRYARDRPTRASGFFGVSGVFFFRFLRLATIMLVVYGFLFEYLHGWVFDRLYVRLTRDLTVERTAFFVRLALYAGFGGLLGACNLVFDYAKVRAVVEDRRSMAGALIAALRFIRSNPGSAVGLYLADFVLFVTAVAGYGLVAPGAGGAGWTMWFGFAIGQTYVLARLWVKLVFWASETALFQARLAHAAYVAAPQPIWPDAPVVEAIGPIPPS